MDNQAKGVEEYVHQAAMLGQGKVGNSTFLTLSGLVQLSCVV